MAELEIRGDNDFVYMLAEQGPKLKVLSELWRLEFSVNQSSYSQLKLKHFIDNLPALDTIELNVYGLDKPRIDFFFLRSKDSLKSGILRTEMEKLC